MENNADDLRPFDLRVLAVIMKGYENTGFAPSVSEIAEALDMTKGGTLADSVKRLESAGRIIYRQDRKYFIPANWRKLAGDIDTHMGGFERGYAAGVNAEKERTRELAAGRLQRFRDKKKKARG